MNSGTNRNRRTYPDHQSKRSIDGEQLWASNHRWAGCRSLTRGRLKWKQLWLRVGLWRPTSLHFFPRFSYLIIRDSWPHVRLKVNRGKTLDICGKLGEISTEIRVKIEWKIGPRNGRKGVYEGAGSMDWTAEWMQTTVRKPSQELMRKGIYTHLTYTLKYRHHSTHVMY